jgi:RNA polymerase sigma factor (sigma-70 family)
MPTDRVIDVLSAMVREPDARSDQDLIAAFVKQRSESAFAELLRRHGPIVFGVCRRILGHTQDAEDAFQAVFIVLARRATAIRNAGQLGGWLYGVAVRAALKARTMLARRQRRELASAKNEAVVDSSDTEELRRIIDEELAQLAVNYRNVIVHCDLNGESRSVASRALGWPEGTVAARLAKARLLLASRLSRRGITLASSVLASVLAVQNVAAVPASLVAKARAITVGSVGVSPASQVLAEKIMRSMFWTQVKFPAALLLLCSLSLALVVAMGQTPTTSAPAQPTPRKEAQSMVWTSSPTLELKGWLAGSVAFSPDGKQMVVGGSGGHVEAYETGNRKKSWELKIDPSSQSSVAYSADGKMLATTYLDGFHLVNPESGKVESSFEEKGSRPLAVVFLPD